MKIESYNINRNSLRGMAIIATLNFEGEIKKINHLCSLLLLPFEGWLKPGKRNQTNNLILKYKQDNFRKNSGKHRLN
jgi:hypothetical protein